MNALIILSSLAGVSVGALALAVIQWLCNKSAPAHVIGAVPAVGAEFAPYQHIKFHGVSVWKEVSGQWIGSGYLTEQQNILTGAVVWVFYPAKGEEVKRPTVVDIRN